MEEYTNLEGGKSKSTDIDSPIPRDSDNILDSKKCNSNLENARDSLSEEEEADSVSMKRATKRVQRILDSDDSESDKGNIKNIEYLQDANDGTISIKVANGQRGSETEDGVLKTSVKKSRIKHISKSCDSSDSEDDLVEHALKNEQQQLRMKNKKTKLQDKFRKLVSSRGNGSESFTPVNSHNHSDTDDDQTSENSLDSQDESIKQIKKQMKANTLSYKTTICDPDTSDEENNIQKKSLLPKKAMRSVKMTSPKPIRMTAKQAMENMKKIKSESNRMLREKDVSLPYHRPKALSLKDIMSRRKPALSSDGKTLPIKMSEEQLKQYAHSLEERQKEMIELCKSDTDEEEQEENSATPDNGEVRDNTNSTDNKIKEISNENVEIDNNIDLAYDTLVTETNETKNDHPRADEKCDESAYLLEHMDEKTENTSNTEMNLVHSDSLNDKSENTSNTEINLVYDDSMNDKTDITSKTQINLVYNESIEEPILSMVNVDTRPTEVVQRVPVDKANDTVTEIDIKSSTETDSQSVSLHYDTEKDNSLNDTSKPYPSIVKENRVVENVLIHDENEIDDFSEDDINLEEIDNLIENAEILKDENCDSPMLVKDIQSLNTKPMLTGAPGMVIDLDGTSATSRKLSGVELLKERFTYFAKLKTPEELERENEKRIKPGTQHLKLKQELEEKIAEQRSLEWAKRLEQEKQQQLELDAIRGDASDDDIEKIEAILEDKVEDIKEVSSDSEEEEEEEDISDEKEIPRKRNPMIDDEAEESDIEESEKTDDERNGDVDENEEIKAGTEADNEDVSNEESSDDESSESDLETQTKPHKRRILTAFEDSDDENASNKQDKEIEAPIVTSCKDDNPVHGVDHMVKKKYLNSETLESQDEDLQLAQRHKSFSDDLFTSQESGLHESTNVKNSRNENDEPDLGTQTFSILNNDITEAAVAVLRNFPEKLNVISDTQPSDEVSLDAVVGMCSGSFSQNLVTSQFPSAPTQSLPIGEDILNLCTGKFYDNEFVSQMNKSTDLNDKTSQSFNEEVQRSNINEDNKRIGEAHMDSYGHENKPTESIVVSELVLEKQQLNLDENKKNEDGNVLKSILDELNDPEFDVPKPNKYFVSAQNKNNEQQSSTQFKKKFVIDSDEETNEAFEGNEKRMKKLKKKKPEKRALQISDDEEDEYSDVEGEELDISDLEMDDERIVEYDSEENEVEVQPEKTKKKRKLAEFLEQEAELTSEDEWVGSGDEDEAGLDRMEREAGDDDTFNQAKLQRELGQIHMRDVLDQDKREVRIIQELLFEDGDLGDGHRQRKFRWRNEDNEEITGTLPDEFADTQEDEFESEEQWRKQRHEREVFLRQMQKLEDEDAGLNVSINRTTIIKANLSSRTMSSLLSDANKTTTQTETAAVPEKITKDLPPSPKKAFTVFKQNYHGSLLSRGGGALARLAALATPLAVDDDAPKIGTLAPSSKRNFVFAALTADEKPKVTKRKAETNVGTPRLIKKMKTKENQLSKNSLLDHLKA